MDSDLFRHYTRVSYHRCRILEGVRVAAFRNIDHLSRVMAEAGFTKLDTQSSVIKVQNVMLRDQGLSPTHTNRWLLGSVTSNAWEVYLCLLYAEIESYQSTRELFRFSELDKFIVQNQDTLEKLKLLRDKLLHPKKDIVYHRALFDFVNTAEKDYPLHLIFARDYQILVDRYLDTLREHLIGLFIEDIAHLPDKELFEFFSEETSGLRKVRENAKSDRDRQNIDKYIEDNEELIEKLKIDIARQTTRLSNRQKRKIDDLRVVWHTLRTPLPSNHYHSLAGEIQTPIHKKLSSLIPCISKSEVPNFLGKKLPDFLQQTQGDFATLIFRSMLIFNESYHYADSILKKTFPGMSSHEILAIEDWPSRIKRPETWEEIHQSEIKTAPSVVAVGLLADPLRMYQEITSKRPELKVATIESEITPEDINIYNKWRNTVFHVADPRVNPEKIEFDFLNTSPLADKYREIVSGLLRFYLRGDTIDALVK